MAIYVAQKQVELREILLKDKPASMLAASEKGTVPVLVDADQVIEESLEVMQWALNDCVDDQWRAVSLNNPLVAANDDKFKHWLDRYKYYERYPDYPQKHYLDKAQKFLNDLEIVLSTRGGFLEGDKPSAVDLAIFPFIRQFAHTDLDIFKALPYPKLQHWLDFWLDSDLFKAVMNKYDVWQERDVGVVFGVNQ